MEGYGLRDKLGPGEVVTHSTRSGGGSHEGARPSDAKIAGSKSLGLGLVEATEEEMAMN
jgi:hypothetical protein